MRKFLFTALLLFCCYQAVTAKDISKFDELLLHELENRGKNEKLRINIVLTAQYDQIELRNKADFFKSREAKRTFVINELKQFSKETQNNLLETMLNLPTVSEIKTFWITNLINCYATVEAIEELSLHPDILIIGMDIEQKLISPPTPQRGDLESGMNDNESFIRNDSPTPSEGAGGRLTRAIAQNITKIQAPEVWDLGYEGDGVVVAILDTGVNFNHNDLQNNMWTHPEYPNHGFNYVNNNLNPMDDNGHGTHCAGTVAGNGASGTQTGVAPQAKIMAIKVLNSLGNGSLSWFTYGIEFGVENGADVLSLSLGFAGGGSSHERILMRNAMNNVLEAGLIASVAAGNEGHWFGQSMYPIPNNIRLPGNCPPPWHHPAQTLIGGVSSVISVGATNQNDQIADFSSLGPVTWQTIAGFNDFAYNPGMGLIRPDLCAPGVDILSLRHDSNTTYRTDSGTSMATPCISGVIALMLSKNPELMPDEICEILQTTTLQLGGNQKNNTFGAGRVNALDAVNAVCEPLPLPISFDSLIINDQNGNNNGKINPGETVYLTVSIKNESDEQIKNVIATLTTNSDLVVINQNIADFGTVDENDIVTVQNAFSVTLSSEAVAFQEIEFSMLISSNKRTCTSDFSVLVHDYIAVIPDIVVAGEGIIIPGEKTDIMIYLQNTGNDDAEAVIGTVKSNALFVTFNEKEQFYGQLYSEQYKHRTFNVTVALSTPPEITEVPIVMTITDKSGKTREINSTLYFNNTGTPPEVCPSIVSLSAEIDDSSVIITWEEPSETDPEKYLIYCNSEFLTETTSTSYTAINLETGIYQFCIEALYPNGCTSALSCIETIMRCNIEITLTLEKISDSEILLSWIPNQEILIYKIYRNSEFLIETENCCYLDADLEQNREYCYEVTTMCGEIVESNPSNEECETITGINELEQKIYFYPNPAKSVVYIEGVDIKTVSVFNMLGQIIEKVEADSNFVAINTTIYSPNIYIVEIVLKNGAKINKRLVIK